MGPRLWATSSRRLTFKKASAPCTPPSITASTYFDVAPYYGRTLAEERLGKALEGRRDKVVLATKCCRDDVDGFDFSAKRCVRKY